MTYEPGDLVYPADLPRRVLCRVLEVEAFAAGSRISQLLRLEPLEGQRWHRGTSLVRRGDAVLPVKIGDLWRAGGRLRRAEAFRAARPPELPQRARL